MDLTGSLRASADIAESAPSVVDTPTLPFLTPLFQKLTPVQKVKFLARSEWLSSERDQIIVQQGANGDFYYFITDGCYGVSREHHGIIQASAELHTGERFGEQALITGRPREATVRTVAPGSLIRLPKDDFQELLAGPAQRALSPLDAQKLAASGACWLDAREHAGIYPGYIVAPRHMPADRVRVEYRDLDPDRHYLAFCDDGIDSAVVSFLLAERGYLAAYLAGGILRATANRGPTSRAGSSTRTPRMSTPMHRTLVRSDLVEGAHAERTAARKLREQQFRQRLAASRASWQAARDSASRQHGSLLHAGDTPCSLFHALANAARSATQSHDHGLIDDITALLALLTNRNR
jgi:CRP-like cAMP-binding protein